jgi:hypothetical protein
MTAEKIDFHIIRNCQFEPVKVRVFKSRLGDVYASIDGAYFNGWELSKDQVIQQIAMFQDILRTMEGVANATT